MTCVIKICSAFVDQQKLEAYWRIHAVFKEQSNMTKSKKSRTLLADA